MKLKEQTFAVIAEKKNSISHKWFNENGEIENGQWMWYCKYYICKNGELWGQDSKPKDIPIYTESQFEELIKKEESEAGTQTFSEIKTRPLVSNTLGIISESDTPLTAKVLNNEPIPEPKVIIPMAIARRIIAERFNLQPNEIRIE